MAKDRNRKAIILQFGSDVRPMLVFSDLVIVPTLGWRCPDKG
ncbi:protein of unknown function [Vibrio tapetis subsp. tapetis]|uniref:Uncharacterized protein n=1 Tax=Vibrio tapetis subsp. tapetis TaxID=1671868 RepID=A0A2N8ZGG5_9VIBR|nr:protein of unknown function [Vibrio tapetis subsp. tapetis]